MNQIQHQVKSSANHTIRPWLKLLARAGSTPMLVITAVGITYGSGLLVSSVFFPQTRDILSAVLYALLQITIMVCLYWFFIRLVNRAQIHSQSLLQKKPHKTAALIIPFIGTSIKAIILFSLISLLVNYLPIPHEYAYLMDKVSSIFIIIAISWIFLKIIDLFEELIAIKYKFDEADNLLARKARTQIIILKRIIVGVVLILTLSAILMSFDNVRELGTSILASAGIAGLVIGLAAQEFLKNLFTSLQIALNQPINLNDYVIVETEFGQIEEITLNYVVVKIWDLRRLILPINYFVEKPFQNLSRKSSNIIGTVFLYVDYTLPVAAVREALMQIVSRSKFWDKNLCVLHVSDAKEMSMELRILVTACNPGDAWELRCEVRENLITFIRENYANSLPHQRLALAPSADNPNLS